MRRLPRILLNLATALSLALCVAVYVLWVRSGSRSDEVEWSRTRPVGYRGILDERVCWISDGGRVGVWRRWLRTDGEEAGTVAAADGRPRWAYRSDTSPRRYNHLAKPAADGWGPLRWRTVETRLPRFDVRVGVVSVSHAAAAVVCGALPAGRAVTWAARRWRQANRPGLCPACGYDLRATPDRCPECGAVPSTEQVK